MLNLEDIKNQRPHFPVLIQEIIDNIGIDANNEEKIYLDCTFGAGGYSEYILKFYPNIKIIAIDRDCVVLPYVEKLQNIYHNRLIFSLEKFINFDKILLKHNIKKIDGVIMDLGFSSLQINDANRGFSFMRDGNLSMEMGLNDLSASVIVNEADEKLLADIIFYYGQEHKAKLIAKAIVNARKIATIKTTKELAQIISKVVGYQKNKINPATKTFQALRIYVNDELNQLKDTLNKLLLFLHEGAKILIVSFHSLEDYIVKDFFASNGKYVKLQDTSEDFQNNLQSKCLLKIITKKPILPSSKEIKVNPPSSSAKLRIAIKI